MGSDSNRRDLAKLYIYMKNYNFIEGILYFSSKL